MKRFIFPAILNSVLIASIPVSALQQSQPGGPQRPSVPQPQQKQSAQYFAGRWNFNSLARESPLGPSGPVEGIIACTTATDGKLLRCEIEARSEAGKTHGTAAISFDESSRILSYEEQLPNGIQIKAHGDWSSAVSIRFKVEPIKASGHTLNLRKTISIISAFSYKVIEELSMDGGPYERLGQGLFTKEMQSDIHRADPN